ncbi:c-type cytochrome [Ramlibacter pallidus]|uniref:C-type cytochrome n=1 Tax=Ramlibacter pallidus TaxID=2780087 RepID=A0ABR9S632_9BURK|nr:c-type cytochrome [Ramlibacter pallidus]MBE7368524.1 c-type cytochrome [Ramlibacter pallidus]
MRGLLLSFALALWLATGASAQPAPFRDDMAQRTLACTVCHGREGRAGPDGYYPRIAGKPAGYLYNQLLNFREGRRHYGLMAGLLDTLSDEYLYEMAQHFARLDLPYPAPHAAAFPAEVLQRGRELALQGDAERRIPACAACHGKTLTGVQPNTPGLLGLPRDYLNAQLGAWRTGQRRALPPDCMGEIARRLAPEDLSAVTAWLASEPLPKDAKPVAAGPVPAKAAPRRKGRTAQPAAAPEPPPMRCGSAQPPVAGTGR